MASGANSTADLETAIESTLDFVLVKDPTELEDELRSRLPISANVLNAVLLHRKWGDEFEYYTCGWENPKEAWIVARHVRQDYGPEIVISRPVDQPISAEMKERLKKASFVDWNDSYMFCSVDEEVAKVLADISVFHYGNRAFLMPLWLMYLEVEEAKKLDPALNDGDNGEIISLTPGSGTEFLYKTWAHSIPGSDDYIEKCLKFNPSAGVVVDGKIVSGAAFHSHGLIGMLYTMGEARGKGYAKATLLSLLKKLGDEGLFPTCAAEIKNQKSYALQQGIGLKQSHKIYFVRHKYAFK